MIHPPGRYTSSYENSDLERVTKSEGAKIGHKLNRWVRNFQVRKGEEAHSPNVETHPALRPQCLCMPLSNLGKGEGRLEEEWLDYKGSQKSLENLGLFS